MEGAGRRVVPPSCRAFEAMVKTLACTVCEMKATRGL